MTFLFLLDNLHLTLQLKPGDEFYEVQSACEKIETSEQTKQRISNRGENILSGLEVEISLKPDQWTRILGQTVLVILILGNSTICVLCNLTTQFHLTLLSKLILSRLDLEIENISHFVSRHDYPKIPTSTPNHMALPNIYVEKLIKRAY